MISLSTCTTVPAMWSRHIAVSFLRTYEGCRHAPRMMFIINQHFLYSFFLILEFLLWTSCPWPSHCCLTQVTHGEQKQKTHSRLSPSSSGASFPWPEWLTSTPVVTLMAPLSQLSPCRSVSGATLAAVLSSVAKNGWTKLFLASKVSSKFRKGKDIIPSTCSKQFVYRCFLLTVKPKQSQSFYPFPRNSIVPTSQQWRENNCVWNVSSAMECRPVLVSLFLFGEPLGVYRR